MYFEEKVTKDLFGKERGIGWQLLARWEVDEVTFFSNKVIVIADIQERWMDGMEIHLIACQEKKLVTNIQSKENAMKEKLERENKPRITKVVGGVYWEKIK